MAKPKTVQIEQIERFAQCLTEMAVACRSAIERLNGLKRTEVSSSNFKSGVERGLDLSLKFVSGVAGSVETSKAEAIFQALLDEVMASTDDADLEAAKSDVSEAEKLIKQRRKTKNG